MAIVAQGGQQLQIKAPVGSADPNAFSVNNNPTPVTPPPTPTGPSAGQPAPTPPVTGPPSITTGNPANTDFTTDSGYKAAVANSQLGDATAGAQRQAAIRAAVIQYGGLPAGFKDAYGDIDQATQDAAKDNQYSTLATLAKQYNDSVRQLHQQLAARGMGNSGELPYDQYQAQYGYGQNQYDAANNFANGITGNLNNYTGAVSTNAQNLSQAIAQAEGNMAANPADQSTQQQIAYNPDASRLYGRPIYGDASTGYYNLDTSKFDNTTSQGIAGFDPNNIPGLPAGFTGAY